MVCAACVANWSAAETCWKRPASRRSEKLTLRTSSCCTRTGQARPSTSRHIGHDRRNSPDGVRGGGSTAGGSAATPDAGGTSLRR